MSSQPASPWRPREGGLPCGADTHLFILAIRSGPCRIVGYGSGFKKIEDLTFAGSARRGKWDAKNVGISPDIEVDHDPSLVRQGKDPQLERAIQEVMAELKRNPLRNPKRPAYADYHKRRQTTVSTK